MVPPFVRILLLLPGRRGRVHRNGWLLRTNSIAPGRIGIPLEPEQPLPAGYGDQVVGRMAALAAEVGSEFRIIAVPGRDDPEESRRVLQAETTALLPLLDVYPLLAREVAAAGYGHQDVYFANDGHFNRVGYELFASAVAEAMRQDALLP